MSLGITKTAARLGDCRRILRISVIIKHVLDNHDWTIVNVAG